jgi:hypothetical protein
MLFFCLAALGLAAAGNMLLAPGVNRGFNLGAACSILRRIPEAFWLGLGLAVVWREK